MRISIQFAFSGEWRALTVCSRTGASNLTKLALRGVGLVPTTWDRPENGGRIIDAGGATVANVEAETEVGFNSEGRYILARVGPGDDPWRLASQELIREVPA
jgi:hypothetical protein